MIANVRRDIDRRAGVDMAWTWKDSLHSSTLVLHCKRLAIVAISTEQSTTLTLDVMFVMHRTNQIDQDVTTSVVMDIRSCQAVRR